MHIETVDIPLSRYDLRKAVLTAPPRPAHAGIDDDDGDGPQLEYVTHMDGTSDGSLIAAALSSREVKLYSRDTMRLTGQLTGHKGPLTQLASAPLDGRGLFSASEDGTVKGWDTRSLGCTADFGQSGEEIWSMAVSRQPRFDLIS